MQQLLIHQNLLKKVDLASFKSNVDKLDIDKLKNAPTNLNNLKSKVDKLDADKLVPVTVNLSKLSDVVKTLVVKKDEYNAKIKNIEKKISDINNLAINFNLNAKIDEVKNKIPNINNFATITALANENKIPTVSNFVKKTDYNTKISETENKIATDHDHDKYIIAQGFNKLTSENFTARLSQANLASTSDIANFVKTIEIKMN